MSSLHSDLCQIPSPHKGLSLLSYVKKAFHHFIFFRVLIITCHCIIYCVAYWFITCHSTRREAACSLGLFVFSLLPLRIMLETLFFFFNFLWKYESKNHTVQICSCYLSASWVSLFFFQTPSPFRGDDVIPQFFLQTVYVLCYFLGLFTISCWIGFCPVGILFTMIFPLV